MSRPMLTPPLISPGLLRATWAASGVVTQLVTHNPGDWLVPRGVMARQKSRGWTRPPDIHAALLDKSPEPSRGSSLRHCNCSMRTEPMGN